MSDLHSESRQFLESYRAMVAGQERLAEGFIGFFEYNEEGVRSSQRFKDISQTLSSQGRQQFDEAYRKTVTDPITRLNVVFPEASELAKKRERKLMDYDLAKTRTRREIDKPSKDPNRLPDLEKEELVAKKIYDEVNNLLVEGMNQTIDISSDYTKGSLRAHLMLQYRWAKDLDQRMGTLRSVGQVNADREIDQALTELKSLTVLNM